MSPLPRRVEYGLRLLVHLSGQFSKRPKAHAAGLAVFNAGRLSTVLGPVGAEITKISWKRQIVNRQAVFLLKNMLGNRNAKLASRIIMFLLTGDLTGSATGAIIIIDQQPIPRHLRPLKLF